MKKNVFLFLLLIVSFATFFVACDLLGLEEDNNDDDNPGGITTEQAKVEVRAASQQLTASMDLFKTNKAFSSLNYLYELVLGDSYKSSVLQLMQKSKHKLSLTKILDIYRSPGSDNLAQREEDDYGFYKYNFVTDTIELVRESEDTLQMMFPADAQAYASQLLNAVFTAHNIQMKDIEYTETVWDEDIEEWVEETNNETVPTNVDLIFIIDDETVMTANYHSTLTDEGRPTEMNASFSSYYQGEIIFTGAGLEYNTTMVFSTGGANLISYNLDLTYTNNLESIEKITGIYEMYPISFKGYMNYHLIDQATKEAEAAGISPDYDYLNSQMDIEVTHMELNVVLGKLVIMEFINPETNEPESQLAIVYDDGSWEWLDDVIDQP